MLNVLLASEETFLLLTTLPLLSPKVAVVFPVWVSRHSVLCTRSCRPHFSFSGEPVWQATSDLSGHHTHHQTHTPSPARRPSAPGHADPRAECQRLQHPDVRGLHFLLSNLANVLKWILTFYRGLLPIAFCSSPQASLSIFLWVCLSIIGELPEGGLWAW